jgi:glycylpeptide N-tetradecanoyltransferase
VPQLGEQAPDEDGFIEPSRPVEEVRQNAYPLPKDFEWAVVDVTDPAEVSGTEGFFARDHH